MAKNPSTQNLRKRVAVEAARLMFEHGIEDHLAAKKKAALRLGLKEFAALPTNQEIEAALLENQRIFFGPQVKDELLVMRRTALAAMAFLEPSRPRLVGAVLSGAITLNSSIELHLFSDNVEAIALQLLDAQIDYQTQQRRVRIRNNEYQTVPAYCFEFEQMSVEALVFAVDGERQSPLCPIKGKPMTRAASQDLSELIDDHQSDSLVDQFFA